MKRLRYPTISTLMMCSTIQRNTITAAISSRNITEKLLRVKSSNVWAYGIYIDSPDDETGDVVAQFKEADGGPGDIYMYLDVPIEVYRKWVTAPSKGHYFWQHIRNKYKYRKLTGDKLGKLPNAVN